MDEIELGRNSSIVIKAGDMRYRISDWGDTLMGGARGPIVIEPFEEGVQLDAEIDKEEIGEYTRIKGDCIIIGNADDD